MYSLVLTKAHYKMPGRVIGQRYEGADASLSPDLVSNNELEGLSM